MQKIRSGIAICLRCLGGGSVPKTYDDAVLCVARALFAGMLVVLVADECAFHTAEAYAIWHAVFGVGEVAVLLVTMWRPVIGSWAIVLLSQAGGLVPFGASPVLLSSCLCAVAVLGFRAMAYGFVAVAICGCEYIAVNSPLTGNRLEPVNAALFAATVLVCALAGALLHRVFGNLTAEQQAVQRRKREQLAFVLHNETCNDVAYLIRRIDEIQVVSRPVGEHDVTEMRSILETVLAQTRAVVSVMAEDMYETDARVNAVLEGKGHRSGKQLCAIVKKYEERLHRLGFRGECIIEIADDVHVGDGDYTLLSDLLGELFADIIKHADSQGGYFVTIGLSAARFSLSACDKPRRCGREDNPTGMGLRRYANRIESRGGKVDVRFVDGRWMADIDFPL